MAKLPDIGGLLTGIPTAVYAVAGGLALAAGLYFGISEHAAHKQAAKDAPVIQAAKSQAATSGAQADLSAASLQDSSSRQAQEANIHVILDQGRAQVQGAQGASQAVPVDVDARGRAAIGRLREQAPGGAPEGVPGVPSGSLPPH